MRYEFDGFELDSGTYALRRAGEPVAIQAQAFELLCFLIERRERVVTRAELLAALWPDVHVSDSALAWCVSQARKALGQGRTESTPIETLHGRGYRFRAEVRAREGASQPAERDSGALDRATLPEPSAPFVGREAVMRALLGAFDQMGQMERGSAYVLTGDAGIGKTRCALEVVRHARAAGVGVWFASCHEGSGAPFLWPWVQILRECAAEPNPPRAAPTAAELLSSLAPKPGEAAEGVYGGDASGTFWLIDAIVRCVSSYAAQRPRLLLFDDLQWADDLSLRALTSLVTEARTRALMLVATLRSWDGAEVSAIAALLAPLRRRVTTIQIGALSRGEVEEYVQVSTGVGVPVDVVDAVLDRSAGNPLFIQEIVRALSERRELGATPASAVETPRIAQELIRRRLERHGDELGDTLEAASILGDPFELALLAHVLRTPAQALLPVLDIAIRERLVAPPTLLGRYSFVHGVVRDAVRAGLSETRRRELHRLAGEAIESRVVDDTQVSQMAFHFHRALPFGAPVKAIDYAQKAARAAANVFAHEESLKHWTHALEALEFEPAPEADLRCRLLLGIAAAERRLGLRKEAQEHLELAIRIAKQCRLASRLLAAARALRPSLASPFPPNPAARDALESALSLCPEEDAALRASALSHLAAVAAFGPSTDQSRTLSEQAIALARPLGGPALLDALWSRIFTLTGPDDIDTLLHVTDELLALAESLGNLYVRIEARHVRLCAYLQQGSTVLAERELDAYGALVVAGKIHEAAWGYDRLRSQFLFMRGRFDEAERVWVELAERGETTQATYEKTIVKTHQTLLNRERGRSVPLDDETRVILTRWLSQAAPRHRERARRLLALFDSGQTDQAKQEYEAFMSAGLERVPRDIGYLAALCTIALVAIRLGDVSRARELYGLLEPYAALSTPDRLAFTLGSVSHHLGVLAEFLGDGRGAAKHLELAVARNEEMGLLPSLCRSLAACARVLSATPVSRSRAKAFARRAVELARELGMRGVLLEAEGLVGPP